MLCAWREKATECERKWVCHSLHFTILDYFLCSLLLLFFIFFFFFHFCVCILVFSSASNWMIRFVCIEYRWMRQCCVRFIVVVAAAARLLLEITTSTVCERVRVLVRAGERALSSKFEPCVWDAIWMSFRWPVRCHRHCIAWICFCYYCYRSFNRHI